MAELWGVLSVLRDFPDRPVAVQVDSEYALKVATVYTRTWSRNGWRTKSGSKVANLPLVMAIDRQMRVRRPEIRFVKVPGHDPQNRYPLNTAADKRARAAARFAQQYGEARDFRGRSPLPSTPNPSPSAAPPGPASSRLAPAVTNAPGGLCASCGGLITLDGECRCSR